MKPGLPVKPDLLSMLRRRRLTLKDHMNAHALSDARSLVAWCEANGFRVLNDTALRELLPVQHVPVEHDHVEKIVEITLTPPKKSRGKKRVSSKKTPDPVPE